MDVPMPLRKYISFLILPLAAIALTGCGGGSSGTVFIPPVIDTSSPTLSLKGANPLFIKLNAVFTNLGATAQDNIDGNVSNKITQTNNVKSDTAGCYTQDYKVSDAAGNKTTKSRMVFVGSDLERHSPNNLPLALEDSPTTPFTTKLDIDVLSNDTDADCDTLKVTSVSVPNIGKAVLNADGSINYDPLGNIGSHSFEYTISDAHGGISSTIVSISSHDPNDGNDSWPDIVNDSATTKKNTAVLINVLANDSDTDGDALIIDGIDDPQHGFITKQNNAVLYTPDLGYVGSDSFFYGVHDGHGHNGSGLVNITITQ